MPQLTEGQYRVGVDFNPSSNPTVARIKQAHADLIDELLEISNDREHPGARCASIAVTELETACMWAVKAVTKPAREA